MRSKLAFRNVLSSIFLQVIIAVTGIIIPRLMIMTYGSDVNGMVSSVTQFISYLSLVEAGVGNAAIVALYVPLANNAFSEINSVMRATKDFYKKSGIVFSMLLLILSISYPIFSDKSVDASLSRWMILILGSSFLVDYFFLGKYRVLLTASQRGYVITLIQSIGTIANSILSIFLIHMKYDILLVKVAATLIYISRSIAIYMYVRKHYLYLSFKVKPNRNALKQRWDVLIHQITGVIVSSTDVVVLTVVLRDFVEISVYTTYNLIVSNIISFIDSFSNGLCSGFGEIYAKKEKDILKTSYQTYEYLYYIIVFAVCTCLGILMLPFMMLYTRNINDGNYIRPITALLFLIITISRGLRTPSLTMIMASGHYKQTRNAAIIEAVINLSVSLCLVNYLGINGVLIGTICSYMYRTIDIIIYTGQNIVTGTTLRTFSRIVRNIIVLVLLLAIGVRVRIDSWITWFVNGALWSVTGISVFLVVNALIEPNQFKNMCKVIWNSVRGSRKNE